MVSCVTFQSSLGTASTAHFSIRWDFVIGAVIFSSKLSLGERAFMPFCCPFLEKPTVLKAV